MKSINLKTNDLINNGENLTFLVGAGCSVDPPSCLQTGFKMMKTIFEYILPKSEINSILTMEGIRFEWLIEFFRTEYDPKLRIIDFFEYCDKPNKMHLFLAEMRKKGHFVITTNFDFLIERALIKSGIEKKNIICIITKNDYIKFSDPEEIYRQGKYPIYKIHGSTKNFITNENTKDSLIVTLSKLGQNKEGLNIFNVEPYKRQLFDNISNERSIIIMGYSGSDDFDIIPTLKSLNNIKNLVWIDHIQSHNGTEKIYDISEEDIKNLQSSTKVFQILKDIKKINNTERIYLVKANTSDLVKKLNIRTEKVDSNNFSMSFMEWLIKNTKRPKDDRPRFNNAYRIYSEFGKYDDALRCEKKCLKLCLDMRDIEGIILCLNNIGSLHRKRGDYSKSLKSLTKADKLIRKHGYFDRLGKTLNNFGLVYSETSSYENALNYFKEAYESHKKFDNHRGKIAVLGNMGVVYKDLNQFDKALKCYSKCLNYVQEVGELRAIAGYLLNIGELHYKQNDFEKALENYKLSKKIFEELNDLQNVGGILVNIATIYGGTKRHSLELKNLQKSLKISELLGDKQLEALSLQNIGTHYYYGEQNYNKALKYYYLTLDIYESIENLRGIGETTHNIGSTNKELNNYDDALKYTLKSLEIWKQLKIPLNIMNTWKLIGDIYTAQGYLLKANKYYEKVEEINNSFKK